MHLFSGTQTDTSDIKLLIKIMRQWRGKTKGRKRIIESTYLLMHTVYLTNLSTRVFQSSNFIDSSDVYAQIVKMKLIEKDRRRQGVCVV